MRSGFEGNSSSAAKRIIPAAAMLALSAVMLSTSTYAWFTMNKEVEMTGLAMSATAGEGMEIALACVNSNAISAPASGKSHPEEDDEGWKSSVIVGHYYENIGKLRPASSADGKNLFDAKDASAGGTKATKFEKITLGDDTMANLKLKGTLNEDDDSPTITSDDQIGYYVDIPVYLRTNKSAGDETEGDIFYKMKIQKRESDGSISTTSDTEDLYKSVRVAFIPSDDATSSTINIFGVNDEYYDSGKAVSSDSSKTAVTVETEFVADADSFPSGDGKASGLKIPYASGSDKYGHLDFTVRVWIEGESKYCSDKTSGQSWNIDFAFSLGKFTDTTATNP
ncbi:MAG: hypothetical protein ACI4RH_07210 [Huintestinicola sp.]